MPLPFGTCGFESHLRHPSCAGASRSPTPIRGCCGSASTSRESAEIDEEPRFNVAPTDPVLAVRLRAGDGEREAGRLRWGLIPHYADPDDFDRLLINARAETVAEAPAFRDAFAAASAA